MPRPWFSRALLRLLLCSVLLGACAVQAQEHEPIPRPAALAPDVHFWVRVYTGITTNEGFIHDDEDLGIVYETLHFDPELSEHARERMVEEARNRCAAALRRMATADGPLSAGDQRIRNLWGDAATPIRLLEASNHVRFQLGQSDRFREGLVRSGQWQGHIETVLSALGLPAELGVLPHVESSFNAAAYSKAGAAGLWQFMRSTGRRYMRIDSTVDDRMDPFRSTEAAAQLLSYNYRLLGTWPLAITAYNHGAEGMRRAKEQLGTDDIVRIVHEYRSPSFGFASRNYYVSFLAALEIDRNPGQYFGSLTREPQSAFQEVAMPAFVNVAVLARTLHIDPATLHSLNPALLPACWQGRRRVPKGYLLRLPAAGIQWTPEALAARLGSGQLLAHQSEPERRRVQRHETLASIAADYGLTPAELAHMNGLNPHARVRPGRWLHVPDAEPVRVALAAPPVTSAPVASTAAVPPALATAPAISAPASGPAEAAPPASESTSSPAAAVPAISAPALATSAPAPAATAPAAAAPASAAGALSASTVPAAATPVTTAASPASASPPGGGVSIAEAQRETEEDAHAIAAPTTKGEPVVTAAQADALSPALGPAVSIRGDSPDPLDYSVAKDDTVMVTGAETLDYYAVLLNVSAAHLRTLNHLGRHGQPVMGRRLKLDFAQVAREEFESKRREYHRILEANFFAGHRLTGTDTYTVRPGDSLATLNQRFDAVPAWLLQQYNPDIDFGSLHAGTQIAVPKIEDLRAQGG